MEAEKIIVILLIIFFILTIAGHVVVVNRQPVQTTTTSTVVVKNPHVYGGCAGTQYGCCPNGITAKANYLGTNCY